MREPKYQAWLGSEMVQVVTINTIKNSKGLYDEFSKGFFLNGENKGRHTSFDLNKAGLRQFTGLHDKNGKEIYEGDIVKITGEQEFDVGHTCRMNDKAVVKWDEKECGYYLDVINKRRVNFSDFESTSIDTFPLRQWAEEEWWIEYEVIGNIHEGETS